MTNELVAAMAQEMGLPKERSRKYQPMHTGVFNFGERIYPDRPAELLILAIITRAVMDWRRFQRTGERQFGNKYVEGAVDRQALCEFFDSATFDYMCDTVGIESAYLRKTLKSMDDL